jgi:nicotinamidase-related amidase
MKLLVVVDMQIDFVDGALGTPEAVAILPYVKARIESFDGEVLFTRDTHEANYMETQEGKHLPVPHCVRGSEGWEIHPSLRALCRNTPIDKPTFGSTALVERIRELGEVDDITFLGLCTDICVISNVLLVKAFYPEIPLTVDARGCAGVTPESHRNALAAMRMCQVEIEEAL